MSERIGFIGLGNMGRGLSSNLCRKGFSVTVFDVNPEPVAHLRGLGAQTAASAGDVAAASDIVFTCLPNTASVEDVALGPPGVLARLAKGGLFVETSTVDPLLTDRLAAESARKGIAFVDAPLGRLATHAERGESLFMVGASDRDYARVKPLLDAMGTTIHHCGGVVGRHPPKLVNNYLAISPSVQRGSRRPVAEVRLSPRSARRQRDDERAVEAANEGVNGDTEPGFTIDPAHWTSR